MFNSQPFGETVTQYVWTKTGEDADGNDAYEYVASPPRSRVAAYPKVSRTFGGETNSAPDDTTTFAVILLPDSATVQAVDQFDVWGIRWQVDGEPIRYRNGFTSRRFQQVDLVRYEGA